jgi:uncharacterized GH25 family protein
MTIRLKALLVGIAAASLFAAPASAHRQWMLPSATTVSGDDVWITVDAAVSNDLFYFEHMPLRLAGIHAWAPDGSEVKLENPSTGRYRSTFDVHLTQKGTYKIAALGGGINGSYRLNGEEKRLPRGTTAAELAAAIPAGATGVKIAESLSRNEIFVTSGEPSDGLLKPTGKGLELVPVTHPNDLIAGEEARFRFLIDGQPAPGIDVVIIPGGIRYRDQLNDKTLKTDAKGELAFTWPEPGFYWLNATASDSKVSVPQASQRRLSYVTTLEVQAP